MLHVFIVNPHAGKGKKQKEIVFNIRRYFAAHPAPYEIKTTQSGEECSRFVRNCCKAGGEVRFYACGGEGTAFYVVNGAVGYPNAAVGVIPCGSGNDSIRYFGGRGDFLDIEAQVRGAAIPVDLIKCGDRYSLNQCSMGMDAEVVANVRHFKGIPLVSGSIAYYLALLKAFVRHRKNHYEITIDEGETVTGDFTFAVAANFPYCGGGFKGAPDAIPNDGLIDCVMIRSVSMLRVLMLLGKYRRGEHIHLDICRVEKCRSVRVKSDVVSPINMDGEVYMEKEGLFEIAEKATRFIVPSVCIAKDEEREPAGGVQAALGITPAVEGGLHPYQSDKMQEKHLYK